LQDVTTLSGLWIEETPMTDSLATIADIIELEGFAFVEAPEMAALLETEGLRDWGAFAASWDDLGVDTYTIKAGITISSMAASSVGSSRSPRR
jgi:hypothetical protein